MRYASKLKVDKASSNLKTDAPVSHWLPLNPELQLHVKLPGMFTHEPPLRQRVFPDVDAHSLKSKAHACTLMSYQVTVLLLDCK